MTEWKISWHSRRHHIVSIGRYLCMFPTATIRSLPCALETILCLFLLYTRNFCTEEQGRSHFNSSSTKWGPLWRHVSGDVSHRFYPVYNVHTSPQQCQKDNFYSTRLVLEKMWDPVTPCVSSEEDMFSVSASWASKPELLQCESPEFRE